MTVPYGLIKENVNKIYVETGTYDGNGIRNAAKCGFKKYYTIDIDADIVKTAKTRIAHHFKMFEEGLGWYYNWRNTVYIVGDSRNELGKIIQRDQRRATIVLDAHPIEYNKIMPEMFPLLDELKILQRCASVPTIIIDDAQLWESWDISRRQVEGALSEICDTYKVKFCDGEFHPNNVLVAKEG